MLVSIRRFVTFLCAGALAATAVIDFGDRVVGGQFLLPSPLGLVAIVVACTMTLLAEGHRRFDQCERRILERECARDIADLGLRHGHLRSRDEG